LSYIQNKKVLVVAVHPDDETLGCGGTLLKHKAEGDEIYWLIVTNVSENKGFTRNQVEKRQMEIDTVAGHYGFSKVFKLDFSTTELDRIPFGKLIVDISRVVNEVRPALLYVPNRSDIHTDHQITFKAMMSCSKNYRNPFIKTIMMYETLSETEIMPSLPENVFAPNVFVDITEHFPNKIEIMKVYKDEMMEAPLPRSLKTIEALARYRGSRIGVNYAEAFVLLFKAYL